MSGETFVWRGITLTVTQRSVHSGEASLESVGSTWKVERYDLIGTGSGSRA